MFRLPFALTSSRCFEKLPYLLRRCFPELAEHLRTRAFVIPTTVVLLLALNFFLIVPFVISLK
jgi:hypothetical protein